MERLVISPETYGALFQASGNLELCDAAGRTLGYFLRTEDQFVDDPAVYEWVRSQVSAEELENRLSDPDAGTTAEVLARLEAL